MEVRVLAPAERSGNGEAAAAPAAAPAEAAQAAAADLSRLALEWEERMARDPATFGAVELEVHARLRAHGDQVVAALLHRVGQRPEMAAHAAAAHAAAELPLRAPEKKPAR